MFLIIFQPFGVNSYDPTHKIRLEFLIGCIGFGVVNGITLSFFEFIVIPAIFKKNILYIFIIRLLIELILLSFVTFLFYTILGNFHDWNLNSFFGFVRDIFFSSIIPLTTIFLYYNYRRAKHDYEVLLIQPKNNISVDSMIRLEADNGKDSMSLAVKTLLFIEAQDNYVAVYHLENKKLKKQLLRATMKTLEEQLKVFSIVRCHRSFMVNINMVEKAVGNNHQLKLYLSNLEFPVATSRTYIRQIKVYLDVHHK